MADLLIENCTSVVTVDKRRRVIKEGAIAVEEGKILDVGKTKELKKKYKADVKIDASGKVAMPGLIDCHVHSTEAILRGIEDGWTLLDWLEKRLWPLMATIDEELASLSAQFCCLEMLKSGTTCFLNTMVLPHYNLDRVAGVVERTGIKAALATLIDHESTLRPDELPPPEELIKDGVALAKKWRGKSDKVKIWFEAGIVEVCDDELYKKVTEAARRHGIGITQHWGEVKDDVKLVRKKYGKSLIEFAKDVGLTGPDVVLVHSVWYDDRDIKILAETKTNVCHCPSSNMKLASGFAKIPEMLSKGVNVALGCDEAPCNDSHDMFREMKMAALLHKGRLLSPTVVTAEQAIELATINGAKALSWGNEIGSIEKGKKADIVFLDVKKPHTVPHRNLISNIVYSSTGADVDTVIIDGEMIVENGIVKTIDEEAVIEKVMDVSEKVDKKARIKVRSRWKEL